MPSRCSIAHILRGTVIFLLGFSEYSLFAEPEIRRAFPVVQVPLSPSIEEAQMQREDIALIEMDPEEDDLTLAEAAVSTKTAHHSVEDDSEAVAKVELEGANSLYAKKIYDLAVPKYEKFLESFHHKEGRDAALFRLAESHRFLGHSVEAQKGYARLIEEFPSGEFTGSAAYRLGETFLSAQDYSKALPQFELAALNAKEQGVRLSALFYEARCLEMLQQKSQALDLYQQIAAVQKGNPLYSYAAMAIAQNDIDTGSKQAGLDKLDQVAQAAPDLPARVEANVRGANVALALNQTDAAFRRFEDALAISATAPEWKSAAWLGLLKLYYQNKEYDRVISNREKALAALLPDAQAEGTFLIANAYRQIGKYEEAEKIYTQLIQEAPQFPQLEEAQFQRLVSLYSMGDEKLLEEIHTFEKQSLDPLRKSQLSLLKAEALFREKRFSEAAPCFSALQESALPQDLKADALYKLGWCYAHSQKFKEAIQAYSQFIEKFPHHSLIASAWLQRGIAQQQINNTSAALSDYDALIDRFPQANEREIALLQRALLLGAKNDNSGMVQTFQRLLSDYPQSAATAQANFWIGWAAYENKNYKESLKYLDKARALDKEHYQEKASFRILLANYYLKDVDATAGEAASLKPDQVPPEISRWLGLEFFRMGRFSEAEGYLRLFLKSPHPENQSPEVTFSLAKIQLKQQQYPEALSTIDTYLATARDPVSRSEGLSLKAKILQGEGKIEDALQIIKEVQLLQPEGIPNAQARLAEADLEMMQNNFLTAARGYMAVSLLYDDPQLTLQALKSAIQAYRQAKNPLEEQKAVDQLKKRFPSEVAP